jgi:flagellar hook-associated protein 3 FlgL
VSTRVTTLSLSRGILEDVQRASRRSIESQQKLSSGRELTRPSDDPTAVARAVQLRGELEGAQQHSRNVGDAQGWADVTDSALSSIGDALQRARELLVQASSDSAGPVARQAAGKEVLGLLETMKEAGNASYGGRFVFAGTRTDVRPFSAGGSDAYGGDTGTIGRQVGPGVTLPINISGDRVLGTDGAGLLASLRGVAERMLSGSPADVETLRGADLRALDGHLDALSAIRAEVGSTANRLEAAGTRLADLELSAMKLLSSVEDADITKTVIDYSRQKAALEASLKAGATIVQTSLLDFLR